MRICRGTAWVSAAIAGLILVGSANVVSTASGESPIYLPEPPESIPPTVTEEQTVKDTYKDGQTKVERRVRRMSDDTIVNHGKYVEYFANGQKFVEGKYINGAQEGIWTYWYDNGKVCKKVVYKRGVADGAWEVFRKDETRQFRREFKNGRKHGTWLKYGADGESILAEEHYVEQIPDGIWKTWYDDGQQHTEFPFRDGKRNGAVREWDKEGKLIKEYGFVDGKRDGKSTTWMPDGTEIIQEYRDGKIVAEPAS